MIGQEIAKLFPGLADWWFVNGPLVWLGLFVGGPIVLWVIGAIWRSSNQIGVDAQCSPSRSNQLTARRTRSSQVVGLPKITSYPSRQYRWHGLERHIERERVEHGQKKNN